MLNRIVPKNRILRQALCGIAAFIALSVIAGVMGKRGGYEGRERIPRDLAQIAWQYGIRSPEVDSALQRVGGGPYASEVVALLDPATGKAAAAIPADAVGKSLEEMTLPSGVKLPSLQVLLNHGRINLRPPAKNPSSEPSRGHGNRVMAMIAPLSPWDEEHDGFERGHRVLALTPSGSQPPTPQFIGEGHDKGRHHEFQLIEPPVAYLLIVRGTPAISAFDLVIQVIAALGALGFLVYWLSMAWWTFKDVRDRGSRPFAWGLLVLFTNLVGVAVYLIARKEWRECPGCGQGIEKRFRFCPSCGHALKAACANCGQPLRRDWEYCANCGTSRESTDKAQ